MNPFLKGWEDFAFSSHLVSLPGWNLATGNTELHQRCCQNKMTTTNSKKEGFRGLCKAPPLTVHARDEEISERESSESSLCQKSPLSPSPLALSKAKGL